MRACDDAFQGSVDVTRGRVVQEMAVGVEAGGGEEDGVEESWQAAPRARTHDAVKTGRCDEFKIAR